LDATAQAYADYLAANNLFQHDMSVVGQEGENLALSCSPGNPAYTYSAAQGVTAWCDEKQFYCPADTGDIILSGPTMNGHYTQNVWLSTTEVGFGVAKRRDGCWVVVARYNPPGNYRGMPQEIGC